MPFNKTYKLMQKPVRESDSLEECFGEVVEHSSGAVWLVADQLSLGLLTMNQSFVAMSDLCNMFDIEEPADNARVTAWGTNDGQNFHYRLVRVK